MDICECEKAKRLLNSKDQKDHDEFTFTNIIGYLDNYHPVISAARYEIIDGILERGLYIPTDGDLFIIIFRTSTANYKENRYYVLEKVLEKYADIFKKTSNIYNVEISDPMTIAQHYGDKHIIQLLERYGFSNS